MKYLLKIHATERLNVLESLKINNKVETDFTMCDRSCKYLDLDRTNIEICYHQNMIFHIMIKKIFITLKKKESKNARQMF